MSGYPQRPPNYGGYGSPPPSAASPYGASPPSYGAPSAPYGAPSAPYAPDHKPSSHNKPQPPSSGYSQPPTSGYSQPPSSGYSQPYAQPPTSGYPQPPTSGYSQPYSQPPPSGYSQPPSSGYSQPPPSGYSHPPPSSYSQSPSSGYGQQPSGYSQSPSGYPPSSSGYPPSSSGYPPQAAAVAFPPGTDPNVIACFQVADQDGSGFIDDNELQRALSSYNQSFSIRTVHLLMYLFTNSSVRKIGPKEFTAVFYSLQNWRVIFERFDRDRSGKIDQSELREALLSLGFAVSPAVLDLLVSKFDKSGGRNRAIEYDNFIECCLTVKGLTEKFREKDTSYSGSATFTYESFMMTVLPFLIA